MDAVKNDIRAHLQKVTEASAKQLAKATGHSETEIANALNSMRVYAEVECEQGGRGKGMMYWLTNAAAGDDKVCCGAAKVMATTASQEVSELREKLGDAEQVIANVRAALGIDNDVSVLLAIERMQVESRDEIAAKAKRIEILDAELLIKTGLVDQQKQEIARLNGLLAAEEQAVDVKDAASGYLVRAPKRKPRFLTKPESAVEAARGAAKTTGRAEVLALVPVGVAVSKKVKAVEYKEASAA